MTVRLLKPYAQRPFNAIATFDAGTEAGLIAAGQASADLTGGVRYFVERSAPAVQSKQAASGKVSLKFEEMTTMTLPEGQVLLITGAASTTGAASRLGSSDTWTVGTGALAAIGPYAGTHKIRLTCTTGSIDATVADAVLTQTSGGVSDIAFAQTIPLTSGGSAYMPQQAVAGALTFTPMAGAVRNSLVYLRLIADGANAPNFSAFKEWGGSMGYLNTAGIANQVQFFSDGVDNFFSVTQAVGATPVDTTAPVLQSITMSGANAVLTYNEALNTAAPTLASLSLSVNGAAGVNPTAAVVSGSAITLTFATAATSGQALTLTYTPGASPIRDVAGNNAAAFSAQAVTNNAGVVRLSPTSAGVVESGSNPNYVYTQTAEGYGVGAVGGLATLKRAASVDSSLSMKFTGYSTDTTLGVEPMIGITASSTLVPFAQMPQCVYAQKSTGFYRPLSLGATVVPTNSVAINNGDVLRLRFAGTTLVAEVSKDSGSTWTTIYTWTTGVSATAMNFQCVAGSSAGVGTMTNLTGVNLS